MTDNKTPKILAYLLPSISSFLWMAVFFGVLLRGQRMINADGDLALHLNLGKYILNTGKIPLEDVFSHTMTRQPVTQHEWLTTVILEGIKRAAGLEGIILLFALVITTAMVLLFKQLRKNTQTLLPALLVILLTITNTIVHWLTRPHIFTFLFLTLWLIVLDRLRQGTLKRWWILPILMLFWVNMHGGFIIGFITWILYGLGAGWCTLFQKTNGDSPSPDFWQAYLFIGTASFLASLLNPSGFGLWAKVVSHVGSRYLADVTMEFQSPNFHDASYWPFLVFIGLLIVILGLSQKKFKPERLFTSAAWLLMGLYSVRNIPLFAIAAAPLLAQGLDHLFVTTQDNAKLLRWLKGLNNRLETTNNQLKGILWPLISVLLAALILLFGSGFQPGGDFYTFDPEVFPDQAVEWLEDNPQDGNMFNYFSWGGYLEYKLWPEYRVFIDSKSDFYGEDFVREYGKVVLQQEGWETVLDQYKVNWVILPKDEIAVKNIQKELEWNLIYEDETAVILKRE